MLIRKLPKTIFRPYLIFLLIKFFLLGQLIHALGPAHFTPIVRPIHHAGITAGGAHAALVDLVHILPARYPEAAGKHFETMLMGIQGRAFKTHIKTHGAAFAPLRLQFQPLDAAEPVLLIIVGIDDWDTTFRGKTDVFFLADFVFLTGMILGL